MEKEAYEKLRKALTNVPAMDIYNKMFETCFDNSTESITGLLECLEPESLAFIWDVDGVLLDPETFELRFLEQFYPDVLTFKQPHESTSKFLTRASKHGLAIFDWSKLKNIYLKNYNETKAYPWLNEENIMRFQNLKGYERKKSIIYTNRDGFYETLMVSASNCPFKYCDSIKCTCDAGFLNVMSQVSFRNIIGKNAIGTVTCSIIDEANTTIRMTELFSFRAGAGFMSLNRRIKLLCGTWHECDFDKKKPHFDAYMNSINRHKTIENENKKALTIYIGDQWTDMMAAFFDHINMMYLATHRHEGIFFYVNPKSKYSFKFAPFENLTPELPDIAKSLALDFLYLAISSFRIYRVDDGADILRMLEPL